MKFVTKIIKVMSVLALFLTGCGSSGDPEIDVEVDLVQISELPELTIYHYEGHYYSLLTDKMNWINAERTCESLGGHLATVTSAEENAACKKILTKEGIANTQTTPVWLGAENLMSLDYSWRWVTGENFSYTHWLGGEPNNCGASGKEHYLGYYTYYGWNDASGTNTYLFLCEWDDDTSFGTRKIYYTGLEKVSVEELPDAHIYKYNGHYYSLFTEKKTWEAAEEHCEKLGGHLVTIEDEEENKVVYKIGFEENIASQNVWMGMIRNSSSILGWVTKEPMNYKNWNGNNPDNSQGKENAVHYVSTESISNKWNDVISSNSYAYLCEWEDDQSFNKLKPLYLYQEIRTTSEFIDVLKNNTRIALLMNDIYLDSSFVGVSEFSGYIDGNGHTVNIRSMSMTYDNFINFIDVNRGTLTNIIFEIDINTNDTFDGIGGVVRSNYGVLENIELNGEIYAPRVSYVGGLVAYNQANSTLKACTNNATIRGKNDVGGLVARSYEAKTYDSLVNTADIIGVDNVGGLVGESNGSIRLTKSANVGTILGTNNVGGLFGNASSASGSSVEHCTNTADITGEYNVAGLFGTFSASYNTNGNISNCSSSGNLIALAYCGAICGNSNYINISVCTNDKTTFEITSCGLDSNGNSISYIGGYAGKGFCITECENTIDIYAPGPYVGGLMGYINGDSDECVNAGNISSDGDCVGGLFGLTATCSWFWVVEHNKLTNYGDVSGKNYVGGIYGNMDVYGKESGSYLTSTRFCKLVGLKNTGSVTGVSYVAGIGGKTTVTYVDNGQWLVNWNYWGGIIGTNLENQGVITGESICAGILAYVNVNKNDSYVAHCTNLYTDVPDFYQLINVTNKDA